MPKTVFYGIAVASVGGPLAIVALYMPQSVADTRESAGLVAVVAAAIFALPIVVWRRYAAEIAGSGGLYSFVEAAVGKWPARVEGVIWAFSYFLYMPYTVVFVVYDVLGVAFPGIARYKPPMEWRWRSPSPSLRRLCSGVWGSSRSSRSSQRRSSS